MKVQKSQWSSTGEKLRLNVGFNKVDRENRFVYGFATLDNVDRQGDRITPEANKEAFAKSRRNLREMHENIAAGRVVDFGEDTYYDPESKKSYKGIFVKAHVSKGAPNTWEKVLDGTLSGFSIGGNITKSEPYFDKALGENVRIIKGYDLVELSLVDNPANQFANVFSIEKNTEGTFVKGMIAENPVENVFYCDEDELAKATTDESLDCGACGTAMRNIGWIEGSSNKDEEIGKVLNKFLEQSEGRVQKDMSEENTETTSEEVVAPPVGEVVAEGQEKDDNAEIVDTQIVADSNVVAENAETEEASGDEEVASEVVNTDAADGDADFEKMFDDLKATVTEEVNKGHKATVEIVEKFESRIEEFKKAQDGKFEELQAKIDDVSKVLDSNKTETEKVAKRLAAVEGSTAVKKSGDVEVASEETKETSIFKGVFLPANGLS